MSGPLRRLLESLEATTGPVLVFPSGEELEAHDPLLRAWRTASAEASQAYADWSVSGGSEAYCAYRAAADRADAAHEALATARS
jgi:hypothetical protein